MTLTRQGGSKRPGAAIVSEVSWLFSGRLTAFLLTFSIPLVLARILTPDDYGVYKQFFLVQGTVLSVLSLGLPAALFYFLPRRIGREGAYIGNTVKVMIASSAVGAIALTVLTDQIVILLGSSRLSDCAFYLALFVVLYGPSSSLESLMIARRSVRLAAATGFGMDAMRAVLLIGAGLLVGGIVPVFVAAIIWACCRMLMLVWYLWRHGILGRLWSGLERTELAEQWRFAWPFALAIIVNSAAESAHQYAVSSIYGPALFAMYAIAYTQIPLVGIAADSTADVALVRMTQLVHDHQHGEALNVVKVSVGNLSFFLLPLYAWLTLNADDFIRVLYTDKFAGSIPLFRVFLVAIPITVLGLDYVPRAFGETTFIFRVNVFRLFVAGGLLAVLLPLYGMIGAAVATVVALGLTTAAILLRVRRLLRVSAYEVLPWGRLLLIACSAAVTAAIGTAVGAAADAPLLRLVVSLGGSAVPYVIVAATLGVLPDTLRLRLLATVSGRFSGRPAE